MSSTLPYLTPRASGLEAVPTNSPSSWLTPTRIKMMNDMSAILAGISLLFCLMLLGFILMLFLNVHARKCLDRVSFRLICYSLISNCFYCIGYIICVEVPPGFFCVAGVWMIQFWLGITNWLITCVALNLELVLVHLCNGLVMEKYYLIGTLALNLGTTLPPLIKGKFGWDDVIGVCWLTSDNYEDRLKWQISTQLMWILLAVFITCLCCCTTVFHLYRHKFTTLSVLNQNKPPTDAEVAGSVTRSICSDANRESANYSASRGAQKSLLSSHEFRSIILRISLYPIVMMVLNLVITIADIRISILSGIYSQGDYALYALYYALYGARGMFYALIAVMDPSLQRAYHVWRGEGRLGTYNDTIVENGTVNDNNDPEVGQISLPGAETLENALEPNITNGISVKTEIYSEVTETKPGFNFETAATGPDIPMAILANRHKLIATTTIIETNNKFENDTNRHTFYLDDRASIDDDDEPQPVFNYNMEQMHIQGKGDGKRTGAVAHWTDLRSDYELSMNDLADDLSSEADLTHSADGRSRTESAENISYNSSNVEGIRLRQRARAQQRRLLEREMKRQI
ncbi:hypothetical protein Dda_4162 [Drechslerella dactyloides]|uniref:G-protein coupled receptors family 2 profile 2 domain-containing protein n=1 Tax=Drechslerella dactyloides TaxID=74499 RepID=A0AAD6J3P4_DREDA|nr:hypothetical protein Dda_4162 [Drechslerella dactyloides]